MSDQTAWQGFRKEIEEAQALLKGRDDAAAPALRTEVLASALPSLLEQCREMAGSPEAATARPIRSIHHFACTGGTLLSRCIAAMPNTEVLSEVDPLSTLGPRWSFMPSDLIGLARSGSRPPGQDILIRIFLAGLDVLASTARQSGVSLILRDHAHSQFCYDAGLSERPTLREMLMPDYTLLSLVSVRHPLDSYLSLRRQDWINFTPGSLEEYAGRYDAFLDRHDGVEILRYEDFVAAPEIQMQRICEILSLTYNADFRQIFPALRLSGDSGRRGDTIAPRPRWPVPDEVTVQIPQNKAYENLCARLGYDPESG